MESYLYFEHFDLVTPDGMITHLKKVNEASLEVIVTIHNISPNFTGFNIDPEFIYFNSKSTLAQLGINGVGEEYDLNKKKLQAQIKVRITAIGSLGKSFLSYLNTGSYIGKLFAADPSRRVRNPDYLLRMFGRRDRKGRPLLSLGSEDKQDLRLEKLEGMTVAFLRVLNGALHYSPEVQGFFPTLSKALKTPDLPTRSFLQLNQIWEENAPRSIREGELLLVRTQPLHIRTAFGRVLDTLLPQGIHHTTASVLEPTTMGSGDVYELFGSSQKELTHIPLEFYTLEPHREHVFFSDRDQLQAALESPPSLFKAFETAPFPKQLSTAVFVVKGEQLLHLKNSDWIVRQPHKYTSFYENLFSEQHEALVENYIRQQPQYPFLKSIEQGDISSQGVLLTRYFPSPFLKKILLSDPVLRCLKGIYFEKPSLSHGDFFSHEDRSFLLDLAKFSIPVFWVEKNRGKILQYVPKPDKDAGMFVPLDFVDAFSKATVFGLYGSALFSPHLENELSELFKGILALREQLHHPLLHKDTPLALLTGGGPGVMELGNKIAKKLNILSCANIVDFGQNHSFPEQEQNAYIDAKMTYRLDRLVERQAEFNLDFPIFLMGGIGTDFEQCLEEVRRKVGSTALTPVLLFGPVDYWKQKITARFQCNHRSGTIRGSEWVSNCFYVVETAAAALNVYRQFLSGTLKLGPQGPIYPEGFQKVMNDE